MDGFLTGLPRAYSPNLSSRRGEQVSGCVIHYTGGGSAHGSVSWLCNPQSKVSAHFVVSRSGHVTQLVPLDHAAWHAGVSEMQHMGEMKADANRFTVGIELANHGRLQRINGSYWYGIGGTLKMYRRQEPVFAKLKYDSGNVVEAWWEPYPDAQIDALQALLKMISQTGGFREAAKNVVGHEEIAMPLGRKTDPGPLFPWRRFMRHLDMRTTATVVEKETTDADGDSGVRAPV